MDGDEKIREAEEILNRVIANLNLTISCKVTGYKRENYQVKIFAKDNSLIMPVLIAEEWVKECNLKENIIHDKLKTLLKNLENYK